MKSLRTTLIYLAVAAILGGYIYFFERGPVKKADEEKKTKVFENYVADDITSIRLENLATTETARKTPIEMAKDEKGVWQILSPKKLKADESTLRTVLQGVGDFTPDVVIDNPANLADYGLNSPNARASFKTKSGLSFDFTTGDKAVGGSSAYIKRADKNSVYLVPAYLLDNMKSPVNYFRDHTFLKTDMVLAKKVEIIRDGKVFSLEKDKNNVWNIAEPIQEKADEAKVRDLLNSIGGLRTDDFVADEPSNLSTYGLAKPRVRIKVWPSDGGPAKSILLGREKGKNAGYYAKSGESPAVGVIGEYFDKTTDIKVSDYRDKNVMKFEAGSAKGLSVTRNGKTIVYKKDDKGQWSGEGRIQAQGEATSLINLLAETTIADFAGKDTKPGLKDPSFVAEVTLADGTTRKYRFGRREKEQVYLASDKTKDVYLVAASVVSQMETYYSTILTPVPQAVLSPTPVK